MALQGVSVRVGRLEVRGRGRAEGGGRGATGRGPGRGGGWAGGGDHLGAAVHTT